jgi:hypothetical protein
MKRFILLLFLISTSLLGYAQVYKIKTTSVAFRHFNDNLNRWDSWTKSQPAEILITINAGSNRIKVFSSEEQTLDIIEYLGKFEDNDRDEHLVWRCVDNSGLRCYFKLVFLNSQNGKQQLYVEYLDFIIVYNVTFLN